MNNISMDATVLEAHKRQKQKKWLFVCLIVALIIIISSFAVTIGPLKITMRETYNVILHQLFPDSVELLNEQAVGTVWFVRIPRILTCLIVGFSLAIAGAVMQPILKNPMASPFTLGISSGAGFGAALAIIYGKSLGSGTYAVIVNAFVFSLLTAFVILILSKKRGTSPNMMILIGVALSHLFSASTTVMQYFADSWATQEVVFWMVGSLSKSSWDSLAHMLPVNAICVFFLIKKSWDLNFISAGDDTAKSLGINVDRTRIVMMILASLITATTISFTGAIGFIGLIAPHITRMIIGSDNRYVVPAAGLVGALVLLISDIVAMNVIRPVIIPIGVMTSFMGVPLFIFLILKTKGRFI